MTSELKFTHFDDFTNADLFRDWSIRTESTLESKLGSNELTSNGPYDGANQEKILRLLVQKVKEPNGFLLLQPILNTAPDRVATSTRGVQAWNALTEYFLSEGINRLDSLFDKFRRHQLPNEKALLYIVDIINVATEIKTNGSALDDDTIKRQLFRGLNGHYGPYVAQLRSRQAQEPLDDLVRELKLLCSLCEAASNQVHTDPTSNPMAFLSSSPTPADAIAFLQLYLQTGKPTTYTENAIRHLLSELQLQEGNEGRGSTCYKGVAASMIM